MNCAGGARLPLMVFSSMSSFAESDRYRAATNTELSVWPDPNSSATCSMLLKYFETSTTSFDAVDKPSHLYSFDLQLQRRILIAYDHGVRVHLQRRQSEHVIHAGLDAFLQRKRFLCPGHNDYNFARLYIQH
jgi:hypothetical protein